MSRRLSFGSFGSSLATASLAAASLAAVSLAAAPLAAASLAAASFAAASLAAASFAAASFAAAIFAATLAAAIFAATLAAASLAAATLGVTSLVISCLVWKIVLDRWIKRSIARQRPCQLGGEQSIAVCIGFRQVLVREISSIVESVGRVVGCFFQRWLHYIGGMRVLVQQRTAQRVHVI